MKLYILPMFFFASLVSWLSATPMSTDATFSSRLFYNIAKEKKSENVVFSPVSIRTCLALAYLGAEGTTASEMENGLQISSNKQEVGETFETILSKTKRRGIIMKMANRIYVDKQYELSLELNELANKYFDSEVQSVRFADNVNTAKKINQWVEEQTSRKIRNMISPDGIDSNTAAVLVNAIYFKAKWFNTFDSFATGKRNFSVSATQKVPVDMMFQEDSFPYGELPDLDAWGIELPYEETDVSMLVVLPKTVDGLATLEEKLKSVDLTKISNNFKSSEVRLFLPKFKIEFDISLQPVLEQMGMKTMFTSAADFSSLLSRPLPLTVSEVAHKAFIEVNESGTEAAAGTAMKIIALSLPLNVFDFIADHPFFFAIKDKDIVYFAGHVTKF